MPRFSQASRVAGLKNPLSNAAAWGFPSCGERAARVGSASRLSLGWLGGVVEGVSVCVLVACASFSGLFLPARATGRRRRLFPSYSVLGPGLPTRLWPAPGFPAVPGAGPVRRGASTLPVTGGHLDRLVHPAQTTRSLLGAVGLRVRPDVYN